MKARITDRLKKVGKGYDLDKLPPLLLKAVVDEAQPLIDAEVTKAEEKAVQRIVNEKFVARVIKETLSGQRRKKTMPRAPVTMVDV
ncbi:MAG: hypothetical protein Q7Q73_03720 [Verrucomicrobiota bacterium JB024]|nr:hypothetical protein [Verrucomicrobiota bacterium JB024]